MANVIEFVPVQNRLLWSCHKTMLSYMLAFPLYTFRAVKKSVKDIVTVSKRFRRESFGYICYFDDWAARFFYLFALFSNNDI